MEHYDGKDSGLYNILSDLKEGYHLEGIEMPYTKDDYKREVPDGFTPQERLEGLSREERLEGLSSEEIEAYLRRLNEQPTGEKQ